MKQITKDWLKENAALIAAVPEEYLPLLPETGQVARHLIDELRDFHCGEANAVRMKGDLQETLKQRYGKELSAAHLREILRQLMAGGLPIRSATSRGYWWEG